MSKWVTEVYNILWKKLTCFYGYIANIICQMLEIYLNNKMRYFWIFEIEYELHEVCSVKILVKQHFPPQPSDYVSIPRNLKKYLSTFAKETARFKRYLHLTSFVNTFKISSLTTNFKTTI